MIKMTFTQKCLSIFNQSINDYHTNDDVDFAENNPYKEQSLDNLLYKKNWIDTVQWHLEDIIRDESISPKDALKIKRRIDASNQERTDMVEFIDSYFLDKYKDITPKPNAKINTETLAWSVDRLSILLLKIYHMNEQATRQNATKSHRQNCQNKLNILTEQLEDLTTSIEELIVDIESGDRYIKVYKQMKMYNDPELNPVLYSQK